MLQLFEANAFGSKQGPLQASNLCGCSAASRRLMRAFECGCTASGATWMERSWPLLFGCSEPVGRTCHLPRNRSTDYNISRLREACPQSSKTATLGKLISSEEEATSCMAYHEFHNL